MNHCESTNLRSIITMVRAAVAAAKCTAFHTAMAAIVQLLIIPRSWGCPAPHHPKSLQVRSCYHHPQWVGAGGCFHHWNDGRRWNAPRICGAPLSQFFPGGPGEPFSWSVEAWTWATCRPSCRCSCCNHGRDHHHCCHHLGVRGRHHYHHPNAKKKYHHHHHCHLHVEQAAQVVQVEVWELG